MIWLLSVVNGLLGIATIYECAVPCFVEKMGRLRRDFSAMSVSAQSDADVASIVTIREATDMPKQGCCTMRCWERSVSFKRHCRKHRGSPASKNPHVFDYAQKQDLALL